MVTLTLRTLAGLARHSDIATVTNKAKPLSGPKTMHSRTYPTAQARLNASYLNLTLWTLQGWVAMFFIAAGYAKLTEPVSTLTALMGWPQHVPVDLVRGVGLAEIVLAVMLLTPLISWKIGRPLLIVAAAGLLVLQTVMLGVHVVSSDLGHSVVNLALLAATAPVLWFRLREACPRGV
ncbi:MAG: DoxX family protein [Brevundimonas sp.]|uniref:DoxX family protein n=1 Tax=Brevundimonas sp. TaxID=1871086 RepID=UPI0027347091|nr:DoxX family protein [Brevundimonas sp.]MDP3378178.1 DoxX family protein [Brevundimonas sp.]